MTVPKLIGIAGGTGSGKTTLARKIREGLGSASCLVQFDWYYRDMSYLSPKEREEVNYDHPNALESELLVEHLRQLKQGHAVQVPQYDFKTHGRTNEFTTIEPVPVIIVEGILLFCFEAIRDMLDIKIYVDTDSDIRAFRRIRQGSAHCPRTLQELLRSRRVSSGLLPQKPRSL